MFHLLKLLIMRASVSVQRNATANEESFAVAAVGRPLRSINLHKVNAPRQEQEQQQGQGEDLEEEYQAKSRNWLCFVVRLN